MMNKKGICKVLFLVIVMTFALSGCNQGKEGETETSTGSEGQAQETTVQTDTTAVTTKVTYNAPDGSYVIVLPDSSWKNSKDEDGMTVFTSEGRGEITITHSTGDAVGDLFIKKKEDNIIKALKNAGFNTDNIEIADLQYDKNDDGIRTATFTLSYKDTSAGEYKAFVSGKASDSDGYQAVGIVKSSDADVLANIQESINGFQVLQNFDTTGEATGDGEESDGGESGEASSGNSDERYFFDAEGNTIYANENEDGVWVDKNGMAYYFYEDHVKDDNGTKFYYDPPEYRDGSAGSGSGSSNTSDSGDTADYYDFYDSNGNHIKARQDGNGNWVGDDGKTYTFGDKGVTDQDGNFHPY